MRGRDAMLVAAFPSRSSPGRAAPHPQAAAHAEVDSVSAAWVQRLNYCGWVMDFFF